MRMRIIAEESFVVIVDIQDKLLAAMPEAKSLVTNASFLIDVAKLLAVPIIATEQYPKGLGPTTPAIRDRLGDAMIPAKTCFSAMQHLQNQARKQVILVGMESHVCILQTALDCLEKGLHVVLPIDAISSRFKLDHEIAIERLRQAGALIATTEMIAFEWLKDASHPQFKAVSKLVIERASRLTHDVPGS